MGLIKYILTHDTRVGLKNIGKIADKIITKIMAFILFSTFKKGTFENVVAKITNNRHDANPKN